MIELVASGSLVISRAASADSHAPAQHDRHGQLHQDRVLVRPGHEGEEGHPGRHAVGRPCPLPEGDKTTGKYEGGQGQRQEGQHVAGVVQDAVPAELLGRPGRRARGEAGAGVGEEHPAHDQADPVGAD